MDREWKSKSKYIKKNEREEILQVLKGANSFKKN